MTIAEGLSFLLSTSTTSTAVVGVIEQITNVTASTTSTNGALVVAGGVGVGGNINVAGSLIVGGVTFTAASLAPASYRTLANGASNSYTLNFTPPSAISLIVTIDGLIEYDWTLSGNTVTFGFIPANNSMIQAISFGVPGLATTSTVTPGSVTSSSFAAGAIVGGLGYTPANKAGDTLSGSFTLNGWNINTATNAPLTTATVNTLIASSLTNYTTTASGYQYTSGTLYTVAISPATAWAAAVPVALVDASTIVLDLSTGINFTCTLTAAVGATRVLANPVNPKPGQTGWIQFTQSATGSNAVTFGNQWHWPNGTTATITTASNSIDILFYTVLTPSYFLGNMVNKVV